MYNVEIQAINKILKDKSLDLINKEGIEPSYFLSNKEHIEFIIDHKEQYGVVPDVVTLVITLKIFQYLKYTKVQLI